MSSVPDHVILRRYKKSVYYRLSASLAISHSTYGVTTLSPLSVAHYRSSIVRCGPYQRLIQFFETSLIIILGIYIHITH